MTYGRPIWWVKRRFKEAKEWFYSQKCEVQIDEYGSKRTAYVICFLEDNCHEENLCKAIEYDDAHFNSTYEKIGDIQWILEFKHVFDVHHEA